MSFLPRLPAPGDRAPRLPLELIVLTQFRTENRCALFLGLL